MKHKFNRIISNLVEPGTMIFIAAVVFLIMLAVFNNGDIQERNAAKSICYSNGYANVRWVDDEFYCANATDIISGRELEGNYER